MRTLRLSVATRFMVATAVFGSLCVSGLGGERTALAFNTFEITGPPGSGVFASSVTILDNGNFVVRDPEWDSPTNTDVGAVYLYDGQTYELISRLTGSSDNDFVGGGEELIVLEGSSNFVVASSQWDNGGITDAGAVTWVNGTTGLNGVVDATNSIVGTTANSFVGEQVRTLTNGNYVVGSPRWDAGAPADVGAATWADGDGGTVGAVTPANSLVGSVAGDGNFGNLFALKNGNYVVSQPSWGATDVGAATWGNGATGSAGLIDVTNSLVGANANDRLGLNGDGITPLANGNYVIRTENWDNGVFLGAGAATFALGNGPTTGTISAANSILGSFTSDGQSMHIYGLTNGNYVVVTGGWNGGLSDKGAVTWGNGTTGTFGFIGPGISLIGSATNDQVGREGVIVLENGNYVVISSRWNNGAALRAGAATWGDGDGGTIGPVTVGNSLVGTTTDDRVGGSGGLPLANGNYVVRSTDWNNGGALGAGAVTWGDGDGGTAGPVTPGNSLVGSTTADQVGGNVTELANGNYVVGSAGWDRGGIVDAGAATWGDGANGSTVGVISAANSLVGSTANDRVSADFANSQATALTNGNYVITSRQWDNGTFVDAGAATWGDGTTGISGEITAANSLVGTRSGAQVGHDGAIALPNGNYVVSSPMWNNGSIGEAGAATWGNGLGGTVGALSASNSLVGTTPGDHVGDRLTSFPNSDYAVQSPDWDNGAIVDAGAVSVGSGSVPGGLTGVVTAANSVRGVQTDDIDQVAHHFVASGSVLITHELRKTITLFDTGPDYVPLSPARLADTRPDHTTIDGLFAAGGVLGGGSILELTVAGRGGVAADAVAATLNVTVTEPVAPGFATVYPCGEERPTASNLNYNAGATVPNAVIAKIGAAGRVCVYASQPLHLVVDVNGYFPVSTSYVPLNPARVIDTRPGFTTVDGMLQGAGRATASSVTTVQITGRAGVPADATAVALNVTVTEPDAAGYATVYPCGGEPPTASNLNYTPGLTVPNLVVSKIGVGGAVCIYTQSGTHLVADVNGYFPAETTFSALVPARLLDTRPGFPTIDGLAAGAGARPLGTVTVLHVAGRGGVPADAATAVLNVTVTEAVADGFLTVYPCGIEAPLASNLNYATGQTVPNAVIAKIGTNGDVCLFNSQELQLVADVTGYFP